MNLRVRLRAEDAEAIERIAQEHERSVAAELRVAVKFYLGQMESEQS